MAGWIIGGFSMLVGGFGIANIMFVSVKERTSIIGIQKALGAKNYFVLLQFLFEAIFLSLIGGIVGLIIVFILVMIISNTTSFNLILTTGNVFLGVVHRFDRPVSGALIFAKTDSHANDIIDIVTNEREIFLRQTEDDTQPKIGRFKIYTKGLQKGYNALKPSANINNKVVIIDEAGYLELEDQGWANCIKDLLTSSKNHILLVVRDIFVEKIIQKWNLKDVSVFNIFDQDYLRVSNLIIEEIK